MVLLAAGSAKRFGGSKLTTDFRGRPLWEWAALAAEQAGLAHRVVVVAPASPIGSRSGWQRIENRFAAQGMGTSIVAGVAASEKCSRILILHADMPLVTSEHLRKLAEGSSTVFTRYDANSYGCPAAFPRAVFPELRKLSGEQGARSLNLDEATLVDPQDKDHLADIDTVRDLERLNVRR